MNTTYYVAGIPYSAELYHHGIKGQKWGIRRFQNEDGTLTSAGKERYVNKLNMLAKKHEKYYTKFINTEREIEDDEYLSKTDFSSDQANKHDKYIFYDPNLSIARQRYKESLEEKNKHTFANMFLSDARNKYQQEYKKAEKYYMDLLESARLNYMNEAIKDVEKLPKKYRDAGYAFLYGLIVT